MTTDFLLEDALRFAYALTLAAVPKLLMALVLLLSILVGIGAAWRLRGRGGSHGVWGADLRAASEREIRELLERAARDAAFARLLTQHASSADEVSVKGTVC